MRYLLIPLCAFLSSPFVICADYGDSRKPTEIAEQHSPQKTIWGDPNQSPSSTNPRWYRNPEARTAYLRGEEDYRNYPRNSSSTYMNHSHAYRYDSDEITDVYHPFQKYEGNEASPSTNPRWYRNPEARDAYLRGDENFRDYPRQGSPNK